MAVAIDARSVRVPRRRRESRGVPVRGLLPIVVALGVWQLLGGSRPFLPPPSEWYRSVADLSTAGSLWPAIGQTAYSFLLSLVIATVVGVLLGCLVGRSRALDRMLDPLLEFLRFTPASAMLPLVVLFAGYDERMKVLVVVLGAVWPVLLQTRAGMRGISPAVFEVAAALRMPAPTRFWKITFPSLLPSVLLGIRIAMPTVLILVLLVELTTNVPGLGRLLADAQSNFQTSAVYGLVIVAALLGLAASMLHTALETYLLRYRPRS